MNELYHYGVKGMRWGVRKEYIPTGRRSASQKTNLGREAVVKRMGKSTNESGMVPIPPELIAQATVYAAILAIYGAQKISNLNKQGWFTEKYKPEDIKKTNKNSVQDNMKQINKVPGLSDDLIAEISTGKKTLRSLTMDEQKAFNKAVKDGYFTNCTYCTTAAALREKGYDVEAKNSPGRGHTWDEIQKWWNGATVENIYGDSSLNKGNDVHDKALQKAFNDRSSRENRINTLNSSISKQGDGVYGDLHVSSPFGMGHSVQYRVSNNKVKIYDYQCKESYDSLNEFFEANKRSGWDPAQSTYMRLDNVEPNLNNLLKKHVVRPNS